MSIVHASHTFARLPSLSSFSAPCAAIPGGIAGPIAGRFFSSLPCSSALSFVVKSPFDPGGVGDGGRLGPMGPADDAGFFCCKCGGKAGPMARGAAGDGLPPAVLSSAFFCRWGGSAGPMAPAVGRVAALIGPGAGAPAPVPVLAFAVDVPYIRSCLARASVRWASRRASYVWRCRGVGVYIK